MPTTKIYDTDIKNIIAAMSSGYSIGDIARNYGVTTATVNRRVRNFVKNSSIVKPANFTNTTVKEDASMTNTTSIVSKNSIIRNRLTPAGSSVNISGTIGKQEYIRVGKTANGHQYVFCSMFANVKDRNGNETTTIYNMKMWDEAAIYFINNGLKQGDLVRFSGYTSQSNKSKYVDFNVNYVNEAYGYGIKAECKRAIEAKTDTKVAC